MDETVKTGRRTVKIAKTRQGKEEGSEAASSEW
jgi:hypothetical protein